MKLTAGLILCAALAHAQAPTFEVAAIRPATFPTPDTMRSGKFNPGLKINGLSLDWGFATLADLIPYAYRVKSFQVTGPSWMRESRWNIIAKLPEGASPDQAPEMIQALLAERFKLTVHHDKREQPVYELIVGKGGPKLEASVEGDELKPEPPGPFPGGPPFPGPLGGAGARVSPGENCAMHMEFPKAKMSTLADTLTPFVDRPVIDQTELKGDYKITLDLPMEVMFAMMQNQGGGPRGPGGPPGGPGGGGPRGGGPPVGCPDPGTAASDASSAPIFQAVQHLGLKLQARKAPFDTIVVDHLDKTPTDN
jgi:uncharacterized protein (TIGR03435 family)